MFDRLQTRIILLFTLLFVAVMGATSLLVYRVTTGNINEQISTQLEYSGLLVQQSLEADAEEFTAGIRLLTSDFGFRTAVATSDTPTIISALHNLVSRIDASSAMLISLDEEILADTIHPNAGAGANFGYPELIEQADQAGHATTLVQEGGKAYEMVLMPVLAPIPVAWLGVRLELDDQKAETTQSVLPLGFDVSFIQDEAGEEDDLTWQVIASTLPPKHRAALPAAIDTQTSMSEAATLINLNGEDFLALRVDFPGAFQTTHVNAVIQYSLDIAFGPYEPLILALAGLMAVGLVLLIGGGILISRSVTRPITSLAQSARGVSEGRFEIAEQLTPMREVRQLATSFNHMIEGIKEREARITYQSEHDLGTGLPNRIGFKKTLDQALLDKNGQAAQTNGLIVMELRIERFNEIRHALGFVASEELIQNIGPRIQLLAPGIQTIARTSGSSFGITFSGVSEREASAAAEDIIRGFEQPVILDSATVDVLITIGMAIHPQHGQTAEELMQRAAIACFQSDGLINKVTVYDPVKDQNDAEKLSLMSELRMALETKSDQISFHYQPKLDLTQKRFTQVEALMRWVHPEKGFVSPEDFIPLAERTGYIHRVTLWAIDAAIAQASTWQRSGLDIKVALNLSARDVVNKDLPDIIAASLKQHEADVSWISLEVTESAVMDDPDLALSILCQLHDMGLGLTIDDFGTGYSSMAYLKKLPIDEIKIDKSFILTLERGSEDDIIVRSTIDLGHNLGLKVTAEGIENEDAMNILIEHGCDLAQGYYFSRPLPVAEIDELLRSGDDGLAK